MSEEAARGAPFSRRAAAWLVAVGLGSLAAAGFLGAFGDALYDPPSFGADGFSRSAVGHRAFVELLRGLGLRVVVSRHRTADRGEAGAVVALLEPQVEAEEEGARVETLEAVNGAAQALLVVLPKRMAIPDPLRPSFVAAADPLPLEVPQRILEVLEIEGEVVRPEGAGGAWRGELPAPTLEAPQLVRSSRLTPLLQNDAGILVGELVVWAEPDPDGEGEDRYDEEAAGEEGPDGEEREAPPAPGPQSRPGAPPVEWRTIVVSDPDLLATHGLGRGSNAALAVRLLERLGAGERAVVVDETLHGLEQQPSLALELVRFPLVLATASALLVGALLAWGALVRFGRPVRPEPPLKPGRLALVDSTAGLLRHGGHFAHAAAAYLRAAKERVTLRHRPGGEGEAADGWLAGLADARGRGAQLREIEERVRRLAGRRVRGEEEAVRTAQAIHRWREEMTDGAHRDPGHDRAAQG